MSDEPAPTRPAAPAVVPAAAPAAGVPAAGSGRRRRAPLSAGLGRSPWLLMYHSVAEYTDDPYRITVTPGRLHRQLRWLRDRGLRGVGVGELLRAHARARAAGLVGLTFDDGYQDFLDHAVPLLRRHACTATVFVLPGRLGGTNAWDAPGPRRQLLTEDGVRAAAGAGMEIGSHGMLHTCLAGADEATLLAETAHSRALLGEITGAPVAGFCYPYGEVDARAAAAVCAAGYTYACAIDPPASLTGPYALPRVHIGDADTAVRLRLKRLLHPLRRHRLPEAAPLPAAVPDTPADCPPQGADR